MNLNDLTLALCQIDSTSGQEGEVCQWLIAYLRDQGMQIETQPMDEADPKRVNILAKWPNSDPKYLLSTHLDTVPPFIPPRFEADEIRGRGTCDAKGIAACMIQACMNLKAKGRDDVGLLFLLEEETTSGGAKRAKGGFVPKVKRFINGEPTELKLTRAAKGVVIFRLKTTGKAGHSAYSDSGFSAVHVLNEDLHRLLNLDWPKDAILGQTTVNIGKMEGGVATNVWAPSASADIMIRTVVGLDEIERMAKGVLSKHTRYEFITYTEPMDFQTVGGFEQTVVAFGSDAPHLKDLGEEMMMIGPGSILDAHTSHEHVKIADLERAVDIYEALCVL